MEQWTLWTGLALQRTRHQPKIYDAFEKIGDSRRTYPDTLPVHVRTNDNTMNKSTRRKVKKYPKKKTKIILPGTNMVFSNIIYGK